jgi:hypothetical protein
VAVKIFIRPDRFQKPVGSSNILIETTMNRKIFLFLLTGALFACLTACGKEMMASGLNRYLEKYEKKFDSVVNE